MDERLAKMDHMFSVLSNWMFIRNMGKGVVDSPCIDWGKRISVYGVSYLGNRLIEEIENYEIPICYAVDSRCILPLYDFPVFTVSDDLPDSDYMIVTAVHYFDDVKNSMCKKTTAKIISLEDLIETIRKQL